MLAQRPGGLKGWTARQYEQETPGAPLFNEAIQQFQGRGIDPVEIFENEQDRMLRSQGPHNLEECVQRLVSFVNMLSV